MPRPPDNQGNGLPDGGDPDPTAPDKTPPAPGDEDQQTIDDTAEREEKKNADRIREVGKTAELITKVGVGDEEFVFTQEMAPVTNLVTGETTIEAAGPTREEAIGLKVLSELALLREELATKDFEVWGEA